MDFILGITIGIGILIIIGIVTIIRLIKNKILNN